MCDPYVIFVSDPYVIPICDSRVIPICDPHVIPFATHSSATTIAVPKASLGGLLLVVRMMPPRAFRNWRSLAEHLQIATGHQLGSNRNVTHVATTCGYHMAGNYHAATTQLPPSYHAATTQLPPSYQMAARWLPHVAFDVSCTLALIECARGMARDLILRACASFGRSTRLSLFWQRVFQPNADALLQRERHHWLPWGGAAM